MASLYKQQDLNVRKTWFLMVIFFIVVIALGWSASWYFDSSIILYIAVIFSLSMNVGSYFVSDKIVLKMSGAKPASRDKYRELWNITENLSITAGLPMPKLFVIEDTAPNAFATGRNPEHSVVAVTTGLLSVLDKNELEGVVAHELSHIKNRDMLLMTVAVVLLGFVVLLSDFFIRATMYGGNDNRDGRLQIIMMVVGVALAIFSPIIAKLIHFAISRKREFLADASGVLLTRYPEGLASALEKISNHGVPLKKANHAMAHLYISNPFGVKGGRMNKMFLTHPPVEERIKALVG